MNLIELSNKRLFKISMGHFQFHLNLRPSIKHFLDKNWVVMGSNTAKQQGHNFKENLRVGDFIYITIGGNWLEAIAEITSDWQVIPSTDRQYVDGDDWIYREFIIKYQPIEKGLQDLKTRKDKWMPSGFSTFYQIHNIEQANQLLFNTKYDVNFSYAQIASISDSNFTQNDKDMLILPLNQILYGPPGTGKTYHTINKALAIIENNTEEELEKEDRKALKQRFDDYVTEGSIVFTTFHQSMSYEDFIEGIKPQREGSEEQPTITYRVEAGVFKRICVAASQINKTSDNFEEAYTNFVNELTEKDGIELETPSQKKKFDVRVNSNKNCIAIPRTPTATQMIITKSMIRNYLFEQKVDDWKPYTIPIAEYLRKNFPIQIKLSENQEKSYPLSMPIVNMDFETIFQAYFVEMKKRVATGTLIELSGNSNGQKWFLKGLDEKGDVLIYNQAQKIQDNAVKKLKKDLKLIYKAYPNYADIKTFSQTVKAKDIQDRLNIQNVAGGLYAWFLHFKEFERVYIHQEFTPEFTDKQVSNSANLKNYVLIIDEINRGNVSQIFGELITLIEEDKRLGKDEALTVTLPYSKEKFGVPSNVYIIGTMNTADRSVEALDTALRRRFSFVEMPPQYNVIKTNEEIEFDLSKVLRTINDRIEVLLNKDNLIGHSYFMSVETLEDLKSVFQNKIMPLLQEYFFGDYGKIGLVLGSGFVQKEVSKDNIFSDFAYDGGNDDFNSKLIYRLVDAEKMNDEVFKTAIDNLINDKKNK